MEPGSRIRGAESMNCAAGLNIGLFFNTMHYAHNSNAYTNKLQKIIVKRISLLMQSVIITIVYHARCYHWDVCGWQLIKLIRKREGKTKTKTEASKIGTQCVHENKIGSSLAWSWVTTANNCFASWIIYHMRCHANPNIHSNIPKHDPIIESFWIKNKNGGEVGFVVDGIWNEVAA